MNHSNTESPTWNSDPYQHHHHHHLNNYDQETSYDDAINPHKTSHSDEEVILASSRPKKRAGRKKFKETRHPVYRGVRQRNTNKWVCEVREPSKQKRIWLGTYPTAEMAARAHDVAALALRGNTACLNFADSVWRLPVPASKDEKDVRRAAAEAAEAFRPRAVVEEEEEGASSSSHFGGDFCMNNNIIDQDFNYYMEKEGVLMSPPPCFQKDYTWDDVETDAEVELWSYSI